MKISPLELVTDHASDDSCGSSWGGHQGRIVRSLGQVYVALTVPGRRPHRKRWQLLHRNIDSGWRVIYEDEAGREPVHLLADSRGKLYVVGWPKGSAQIWEGKPINGNVVMMRSSVPGMVRIHQTESVPYSGAAITSTGDLFVLSTQGEAPSEFMWAYKTASRKKWNTGKIHLDLRYCYTYVLPGLNEGMSLVSNRDVRWAQIRFPQPEGAFDYVFNAIGLWHIDNFHTQDFKQTFFMEEAPTLEYPNVLLNAQTDVFMDRDDRLFILYRLQGPSTQGKLQRRMACMSPEAGKMYFDIELPDDTGKYCRLVQSGSGGFYLLGSSGIIYSAGKDGKTFNDPVYIDLGGYHVEYSGFSVSTRRTGTRIENVVDVIFPTNGGKIWMYFNIEV